VTLDDLNSQSRKRSRPAPAEGAWCSGETTKSRRWILRFKSLCCCWWRCYWCARRGC
jgi:hypothetical protein